MPEPRTMYVGLEWDEYTPTVEGQLTRDLISLKNAAYQYNVKIRVVTPNSQADRLLHALGIDRLPGHVGRPNLYLVYQANREPVAVPSNVRTIKRVLYRGVSHSNRLRDQDWNGLYLKEQDRGYYNSQFRRAPPPNNQWSTLDPLVTMVWSR